MKISKNSWHYRLQHWVFKDGVGKNLCQYTWMMLASLIMTLILGLIVGVASPFIALIWFLNWMFEKTYGSRFGKYFVVYDKYLLLLINGVVALVFIDALAGNMFYTSTETFASAYIGSFVAAFTLLFFMNTIIIVAAKETNKPKNYEPDDLIGGWIKAKKEKVCPLINFVD